MIQNLELWHDSLIHWTMHLLAPCLVPMAHRQGKMSVRIHQNYHTKLKLNKKNVNSPLRLHLPEGSTRNTDIFSGYTLQYIDTLFTFKSVLLIYFVKADASNKTHTFPVKSSHRRPSGKGSPPGFAPGNTFWHSGIDIPLKRMP